MLFHAPNADIQTVLSKKWLAVENQVWHAPVARFLKRLLIDFDSPVIFVEVHFEVGFQHAMVQTDGIHRVR